MTPISVEMFNILNQLPDHGKFEKEQTGSSPTDLVYRFTIYGFDKTKTEITVDFLTMFDLLKQAKKGAL